MLPFFVSPGAVAKLATAKEKPPAARKPAGPRNSVGYVQTFVGPQRRPKARMPIDAHAEVGRLLKSVLTATYHRKGVYKRVNAIRSELDEWTQREYNHAELPNEQFFELYNHESGSTFERALSEAARARHGMSLTEAKKILTQHYPDCPPLRSLLQNLMLPRTLCKPGPEEIPQWLAQNKTNTCRRPRRPFVPRPSWRAAWRLHCQLPFRISLGSI